MTSSKHGNTRMKATRKNNGLLIFWLLVVSFFISVSSAAVGSQSFSFAVFGDNHGDRPVFRDLIKHINKDKSIKFCVNTGDFVVSASELQYQRYKKATKKLRPKLYNVVGNHDVYRGGYKYYKKYYGPTYYSFDYQGAHFVLLDNAWSKSFNYKQFAWLKKDLAKYRDKKVFVFIHKPIFDPTDIFKDYMMSGRKVAAELVNFFAKNKVDYVCAGHIHGYAKAKRKGVNYQISGGAGAPLHLPREWGGFYHYVKITVDKKGINAKVVRFYE